MTISYNWLKDYIKTQLSAEQIAHILTATGLEVESVEKRDVVPGGLRGIVVGEVLECTKHPDADRLSITRVNIGQPETLQIVCGAPNVAAGQKVLVATIGTQLHPTDGEPFTIKKGKIRGQESWGMICAEDELGLGKSHDGIWVLDPSAQVGMPAAQHLAMEEDYILEIGLTPNRTDAFSHFGVARDLAAALRNMQGVPADDAQLLRPFDVTIEDSDAQPSITLDIQDQQACPRYCGLEIKGIAVTASPEWLQKRLTAIGLRPINNVVDITNYVQHEMGQPLHAFDRRAIQGDRVVVRLAKEGETITTLDQSQRSLTTQDLVICNAVHPMCIAGVMGGSESGVTDTTTDVFLESAYFNPVFVRRTARKHAINTDSSFRFERGCDPTITRMALQRAAQLIIDCAGGKVVAPIQDFYPQPLENHRITFRWEKAFALIGQSLDRDRVKSILKDLEIIILEENDSALELSVPLYRTDVTREADVVEEVLRIYGYDHIQFPHSMKISLQPAPQPDVEALQNKVADFLSANGYSEMMSMSFTKRSYADLLPQSDTESSTLVELINPLSNDLAVMRQTLMYSGLEAIAHNRNHRQPDLRLYEFGKIYSKEAKGYQEEKRLAIFITGRRNIESWNNPNDAVSFMDMKAILDNLLRLLRIRGAKLRPVNHAALDEGMEWWVGKQLLIRAGAVSTELSKVFDVKQRIWYAEVFWETCLAVLPRGDVKYHEPERFPAVKRDLSLLINKDVSYADIERLALETERKLLKEVNLFDVYEGKNLAEGKKSYAISFLLQDSSKTMTDEQTEQIMQRIQQALETKLGAELRQ